MIMGKGVYAKIEIELSKAGLRAYCEELDEDVFCVDGDLSPLVKLINDAEMMCNPDVLFSLTEKGKKEFERIINKKK